MALISASQTKQALWQLALQMDPQVAVYGVRTAATTATGPDTFVYYKLQRVTYQPYTFDVAKFLNRFSEAIAPKIQRIWVVYQVDLDNAYPLTAGIKAPAPTPELGFTLKIKGQVWVAEKIVSTGLDAAWQIHSLLNH